MDAVPILDSEVGGLGGQHKGARGGLEGEEDDLGG